MPAVLLSPIGMITQLLSDQGIVGAGFKLNTYVGGTVSTPQTTYTDSTGTVTNSNPLILGSNGRFQSVSVWAIPGTLIKMVITDSLNNLIAGGTIDNIPLINDPASFTAGGIGAVLYPRSSAEISASITPTNYAYAPGSVLRYGADPTGVADSATAFSNAIAANSRVFDDYPGGGSYLFNSEVVISRYPITIEGATSSPDFGSGGTKITLATVAGAGKAALRTTAIAWNVSIKGIGFKWQTLTTGQIGIRFAELRASKVEDCFFVGAQTAGTTVVGIQFDGTGTFTGAVAVKRCYLSALLYGIDMQGVCTSMRINDCDFTGYVSGATSYGIKISNTSRHPVIGFNYFEGWTRGIFSQGGNVHQIANGYEANTVNWEWQRGVGNARIWNQSIAEDFVSGGAPIYPFNDIDACMVLSGPPGGTTGGAAAIDVALMQTSRGFNEHQRAENLGEWVTRTFSAANYQTSGGGTWTVASGNVKADEYTRFGLSMVYEFTVEASTTTAGPTQLVIVIPAARAGQKKVSQICYVDEGGTKVACLATIDPAVNSGTSIAIFKLSGAAFAATITGLYGQITFEIT